MTTTKRYINNLLERLRNRKPVLCHLGYHLYWKPWKRMDSYYWYRCRCGEIKKVIR
jgi:hypothetical protein